MYHSCRAAVPYPDLTVVSRTGYSETSRIDKRGKAYRKSQGGARMENYQAVVLAPSVEEDKRKERQSLFKDVKQSAFSHMSLSAKHGKSMTYVI